MLTLWQVTPLPECRPKAPSAAWLEPTGAGHQLVAQLCCPSLGGAYRTLLIQGFVVFGAGIHVLPAVAQHGISEWSGCRWDWSRSWRSLTRRCISPLTTNACTVQFVASRKDLMAESA